MLCNRCGKDLGDNNNTFFCEECSTIQKLCVDSLRSSEQRHRQNKQKLINVIIAVVFITIVASLLVVGWWALNFFSTTVARTGNSVQVSVGGDKNHQITFDIAGPVLESGGLIDIESIPYQEQKSYGAQSIVFFLREAAYKNYLQVLRKEGPCSAGSVIVDNLRTLHIISTDPSFNKKFKLLQLTTFTLFKKPKSGRSFSISGKQLNL